MTENCTGSNSLNVVSAASKAVRSSVFAKQMAKIYILLLETNKVMEVYKIVFYYCRPWKPQKTSGCYRIHKSTLRTQMIQSVILRLMMSLKLCTATQKSRATCWMWRRNWGRTVWSRLQTLQQGELLNRCTSHQSINPRIKKRRNKRSAREPNSPMPIFRSSSRALTPALLATEHHERMILAIKKSNRAWIVFITLRWRRRNSICYDLDGFHIWRCVYMHK